MAEITQTRAEDPEKGSERLYKWLETPDKGLMTGKRGQRPYKWLETDEGLKTPTRTQRGHTSGWRPQTRD